MNRSRSDEGMAAWSVLMEAHALVVDAIEKELQRGQSLPLTSLEVLVRLSRTRDGALRMQDLAEQLVFSRSGVTRLVDRLETAGLVERAGCPSDRRGTYAVLTDTGRAALERAHPVLHRAVREHFARYLSDAETQELESILARVLKASGQDRDDGDRSPEAQSEPAVKAEAKHP